MSDEQPDNLAPRQPDKLNARQTLFVAHYIETWNATEAAKRAGYSEKTARFIGAENLTKPNIAAAIKAHIEQIMPAGEVLHRLAEHARGSMEDVLSFRTIRQSIVVVRPLREVLDALRDEIDFEVMYRNRAPLSEEQIKAMDSHIAAMRDRALRLELRLERDHEATGEMTIQVDVEEPGLDLDRARQLGKLHLVKSYNAKDGKVDLYDAQAALALVGRKHRLFIDKVEHEGEIRTAPPITSIVVKLPAVNLWTISDDGTLTLNLHPGQARAWQSERRFIAILAGTQGGKTSFLPWWLYREIGLRGAGDYIAVTSSYDLFKLKFLPAMRECFEHVLRCGRYWSSDRIIELADPKTGRFKAKRVDDPMWGRIILRSAESGGGLESATAKGAVLDEAGQDAFTLDTWQAVNRRVTLNRGRILIGTTLYNLGYLKQQVYDRWKKGDPTYDVIQFDSTENPEFPKEEAERAEREMPRWKYNMQYRGLYERPAGLIYDNFIDSGPGTHTVPRFAIPDSWQRYLGLDFGGVNTAGLFYAAEPNTTRLYLYREYKAGGLTAAGHAAALLRGEPMIPVCVGGSGSEGQWRNEFRAGGLPVREPDVTDVEVGIDRVYGTHARNELFVFDDLDGYLDQKGSYSRKVDEQGEVTEDIKDKAKYHFMDAERYIIGWLRRTTPSRRPRTPAVSQQG